MRAAVREVAKYFPTAIISGRSRDKVYIHKFILCKSASELNIKNTLEALLWLKI